MKNRRIPIEILAILIVLTILGVVLVSPAFSSNCVAGGECIIGVEDRQQDFLTLQRYQSFRAHQVSESDCPSSFEERVILLINVERANAGVTPLTLDIRLQAAARWMSDDMADEDRIPEDHIGSDGSTVADRILREGYIILPTFGAENIAGGYQTPESVVAAWMGITGDKANILDPGFEHLGVGYTYQDMPYFDHYWTVNFGATNDPRQPPFSTCDPSFYRMLFPVVVK